MWLLLWGPVLAAGHDVPVLTADERARLDAGEVVLRASAEGARVTATGLVRVHAPPDALWPAVLDVAARVGEGGTLAGVHEYRREGPTTWYLEVDLKVFGTELSLHHRYSWDPGQGVATYTLDQAMKNDLAVADGWYLVRAERDGSLLVYEAVTEARVPVPDWLRRWLARDQMQALLEGIRTRAEAGRR